MNREHYSCNYLQTSLSNGFIRFQTSLTLEVYIYWLFRNTLSKLGEFLVFYKFMHFKTLATCRQCEKDT